jgi:ribonuclease-3
MIRNLPSAEELKDAKTKLQEWLQARGRPLPVYRLEREEGADHARKFHVCCLLPDDGLQVTAAGDSRRKAEQTAAAELLSLVSAQAKSA